MSARRGIVHGQGGIDGEPVVRCDRVCLALAASASASASDVSFDFRDAVGEFGIGRESFDRPVDVVRDRDENIYVVDQGNNRIQVLDRRGRFLREWGGRGFAPGFFDRPNAIAFDRIAGLSCTSWTRGTTGSRNSTSRGNCSCRSGGSVPATATSTSRRTSWWTGTATCTSPTRGTTGSRSSIPPGSSCNRGGSSPAGRGWS